MGVCVFRGGDQTRTVYWYRIGVTGECYGSSMKTILEAGLLDTTVGISAEEDMT